jgi:hypothetical protein
MRASIRIYRLEQLTVKLIMPLASLRLAHFEDYQKGESGYGTEVYEVSEV